MEESEHPNGVPVEVLEVSPQRARRSHASGEDDKHHFRQASTLRSVTSFATKDVLQLRGGMRGGTTPKTPKLSGTSPSKNVTIHDAVPEILIAGNGDDEDADNNGALDACDSPLLIHCNSGVMGATVAAHGVRCDSGATSVVADHNGADDSECGDLHGGHLLGGGGHHHAITLGICCMAKKLKSETMTAMIRRFEEFGVFRVVAFPQDMILDAPVEQWPHVDVMISFFSSGFPLDKAVDYAHRHPDVFFLTHPASQQVLLDRRGVYSALKRNNVPTVRNIYCSRDGYQGEPVATLAENIEEEYIEVNGERFHKPFVEKPVDSEDHNVYIYYDKSRGGGCRMLFRKKENESSAFDPDRVHVRHDGSFVYEEYVETANFMDVKCYTVGVHFVHAEQRKAPCVDGIVLRSTSGKEIREEVQLTPDERMVARKVIKVFRQLVCGFDLLRSYDAQGRPTFFVCDVNGWSFVKNNPAYVHHATEIMRNIFVEEVRKRGLHRVFTAHPPRYLSTPCRSVDNMSMSAKQHPFNSSGHLLSSALLGCSIESASDVAQRNMFLMGSDGGGLLMANSYNAPPSVIGFSPNPSALQPQLPNERVMARELIGVVGVLRHADRTPKQKVKILLSAEVLLDLVFGVVDSAASPTASRDVQPVPIRNMTKELVFKCGHPVLARIQDCAQQLLDEMLTSEETSSHGSIDVVGVIHTHSRSSPSSSADVHSAAAAVTSIDITARTPASPSVCHSGTFPPGPSTTSGEAAPASHSGTPVPPGPPIGTPTTRSIPFRAHAAGDNPTQSVEDQLRLIIDVLNRKHEGLKVQIRPSEWDENGKCVEALLICKWGGWLTDAGHKQAEMLGNHFIRRMFGAEPSEHCVSHNQLRITTNNERRVIYTGLDFARCLLKDTSITESQCHVNEALLGCSTHAKDLLGQIAEELANVMHIDVSDTEELAHASMLPGMGAMLRCCVLDAKDQSPRGALRTLHRLMKELVEHIPPNEAVGVEFYRKEPIHLMRRRWENLCKSFFNKKSGRYDTSKITDIFDYVSYDVCYNQEALAPLDLYPLFTLAEVVSQFVSDGEYGLTFEEKRLTGCLIATPLLQRINNDLHAIARHQSPLTRLYFTSQSHVMALKNLLYHSEEPFHRLDEPQALHFLTHIVFKAYRYIDTGAVQLEVHFSAGMDKNMFGIVQEHHVEYSAVTPMIRIHNDLSISAMQRMTEAYSSLYNSKVPLTSVSAMSSGTDGQ